MLKITNVKEDAEEDGVILVNDALFLAIATILADNNCFPKVYKEANNLNRTAYIRNADGSVDYPEESTKQ